MLSYCDTILDDFGSVQDWPRHKKICKPTRSSALNAASSANGGAKTPANGKDIRHEFDLADFNRQDGKEYVVEMAMDAGSSKTYRLSSKALSPAVLRELRDSRRRNLSVERRGGI